jgi:tRNA modification GTPase
VTAPGFRGGYALLTPPGPAAIASIRVWGPAAADFAAQHLRLRKPEALARGGPGSIHRAALLDQHGAPIDDVLVSVHAAQPHWDLRLHLHGNPVLVEHSLRLLAAAGLNAVASPDDLWAAQDLLEAEALALLPRCTTRAGVEWLLAQPVRLRAWAAALAAAPPDVVAAACTELLSRQARVNWYISPTRIALAGAPNAGKSSLINALTEQPTSLVAPAPGTTRDWVEGPGASHGFPVVWLDTAGLRASDDPLEQAGMARTSELIATADALVYVIDVTQPLSPAIFELPLVRPTVIALNKVDLEDSERCRAALPGDLHPLLVDISAERRWGLQQLQTRLWERCGRALTDESAAAPFTPRQVAILQRGAAQKDCNIIEKILLRT